MYRTHHTLAYHHNVLYCISRGAYSNHNHLIKLVEKCRTRTSTGAEVLKAIHNNRFEQFLKSKFPSPTHVRPNLLIRFIEQNNIPKSDQQIHDAFSSASIFQEVAVPINQSIPLPSLAINIDTVGGPPNLADLVELHEEGIRVEWPAGFDTWQPSKQSCRNLQFR